MSPGDTLFGGRLHDSKKIIYNHSLHMPSSLHRVALIVLAAFFVLAPVGVRAAGDQAVTISANDQMKFDTTDISGAVGQKIVITLTNDGSLPKAAMAHNIVVLKPGTDVAAFIASASASPRASAGYLPDDAQAGQIIVHTKLLGPGEEDTITFTPTAAGVYEYVCTFPGHTAAGMRGKIIVQ